jgi:hypothetical protein
LAVPVNILLDEQAALCDSKLGPAIRAEAIQRTRAAASAQHSITDTSCDNAPSPTANVKISRNKRQRKAKEAITEDNSISVICLLLWELEKGEHSHVKGYIDMLPKRQSEMVLVGLEKFETDLRGSELWTEWVCERQRFVDARARVRSILSAAWPPCPSCTNEVPNDDAIDLARSWFWSRAIAVPVDSQGIRLPMGAQHAAMVPLLDSLNHSLDARMDLVAEGKHVVLRARALCPSAHPVCINYGYLSSIQCLIRYGFLPPKNDANTLSLCFDMSTINSHDTNCSPEELKRTFPVDAMGRIPKDLLDFTRASLCNEREDGGEPVYCCGTSSVVDSGSSNDIQQEGEEVEEDDASRQAALRRLLLGDEDETCCEICGDNAMGLGARGKLHESLVLQTLVCVIESNANAVRGRSEAVRLRCERISEKQTTTLAAGDENANHSLKVGEQLQRLCAHELRSLQGLLENFKMLQEHLTCSE